MLQSIRYNQMNLSQQQDKDMGIIRERKGFRSNMRLFYNRVPKCGSTTLLALIKSLAKKRGFTHLSSRIPDRRWLPSKADQERIASNFAKLEEPCSMDRHVFFIDFSRFLNESPILINLIRDPINHLESHYYYSHGQVLHFQNFNVDETTLNETKTKMTFDQCILNGNSSCQFVKGEMNRMLLMPYFCGHDPRCQMIDHKWALSQAKRNIEKYYAVVGILEDLKSSISAFEHVIPHFFKGMLKEYEESEKKVRNRNPKRKPVSPAVREMIKRNISTEFELYEFVKKRLYATIQMNVQIKPTLLIDFNKNLNKK